MAILHILTYPDPRLHRVAAPVENVDDEIRRLVDNLAQTMYRAPGVGLAAPQVDIRKRVLVIDVSEQRNELRALINPEILARDGEQQTEEGCLSVPGIYFSVARARHVRVRALAPDGEPFELEAEGMLSVCLQHEIDHLDGKVFVDYLSPLKRERIAKKLTKQVRRAG